MGTACDHRRDRQAAPSVEGPPRSAAPRVPGWRQTSRHRPGAPSRLPGARLVARRQRPPRAADQRPPVAAALETASAQREAIEDSGAEEVPVSLKLKSFFVRRAQSQVLIGVSEAAARLEISRTTIYDWVAKKQLLAWKSTKRGLTIPLAQILGPGRVVPGLARILDIIDDPELAWAFLTQDWPFADSVTRPLDKLARDEVEKVATAAPGFGMSFT